MKIFQFASEVVPFSRTGSVGDVVGSLSTALVREGHDVTVFSPAYLGFEQHEAVEHSGLKTWVDAGGHSYEFDILTAEVGGVSFRFMANDELFGRRGMYGAGEYGYSDNDIRFGSFCLACLNHIKYHGLAPDIIHCHGWQTGLVPVYARFSFPDIAASTVFTVHDLSHQGIFSKFSIEPLNLPWDAYTIEGLEFYDNLNVTKGGIVFSDAVTAMSPTAAKEIAVEPYGFGLEGAIAPHREKITGILPGIDTVRWNPADDPHTSAAYDADDVSGKAVCKQALADEFDLDEKKPFIGVISRFSAAKGMELLLDNQAELAATDAEFIILGYHEGDYLARFAKFAADTANVTFIPGFEESVAHRLYAGIDILLVPSMYEPGGVSQLIGQRYGVIPVARRTGGLKDAVEPMERKGCGFLFDALEFGEMKSCIDAAISLWRDTLGHGECLCTLMGNDVSWRRAVTQYIDLYTRLREVS